MSKEGALTKFVVINACGEGVVQQGVLASLLFIALMSIADIICAMALTAPGDFKALDRDCDGFISAVELRSAMACWGEKFTYE